VKRGMTNIMTVKLKKYSQKRCMQKNNNDT
jgi:hypothetical protein